MKKAVFYLFVSILWLVNAIIFLFLGKSWAAIVDIFASIAFFCFFLQYRRKKSG